MAPIDEKMRESSFRWFVHMQRREINAPMRKSDVIQDKVIKRDRGRLEIILVKVKKGHVNYGGEKEYYFGYNRTT